VRLTRRNTQARRECIAEEFQIAYVLDDLIDLDWNMLVPIRGIVNLRLGMKNSGAI
jgi:hypothetical protein